MVRDKPKIVFFCPKMLRNSLRQLFQLDRLEMEGFDFVLLDATKYYKTVATATEDIILNNKVECETRQDFIDFRNKLPEEPVVFLAFDFYMIPAAPILNIIVRDQDKLLSYFTKRFSSISSSSGKVKDLIGKGLILSDKILPRHLLKIFYKKKYKMFIPDYYLCSTEYLIPPKVYLTVKKSHRIVVHADDINNVLEKDKNIIDPNKKIGVFLDQGLPFLNRTHPGLYKKPIPDEYLERYYDMVEKTLIELKENLGLDEIVIALHPDAVKFKKELAGKFAQFRTFLGVTKDLIRDAHIVFGHSSTAFSFAIYYKKPLLIFKDKFIIDYHPRVRKSLVFFNEELGMRALDMEEKVDIKDISEVPLDLKKYGDYTNKYLKDNNIEENAYYYAIQKIIEDLEG